MTNRIKLPDIPSSEITPEGLYLSRRRLFTTAALGMAGAALLAACKSAGIPATALPGGLLNATSVPGSTDELGGLLTPETDVTHYNNFYEFSFSKTGVADQAKNLILEPWKIEVSGLVRNPKTYDIDDLRTRFASEEPIYRLRCVEGWAMVIPWQGFQLSRLLDEVEPMTSAGYVRFVSLLDPAQMPGQNDNSFPWPYEEGLRLDEAQHPLSLMATGLYGKPLAPQNGAPLRLVVPWKYGYKSIKSIVKIELVEKQPATFWNQLSPLDYGFYSNVNPEMDYPRFNQASEIRIGLNQRIPTQMFNGYESEVAGLYAGMDPREYY
jgi:methionine sulfoxide reductase catalytic subunit